MNANRLSAGWVVAWILMILSGALGLKLYDTAAVVRQRDKEIRFMRAEVARATKAKERVVAGASARKRTPAEKSDVSVRARESAARVEKTTLDWIKHLRAGSTPSPFFALVAGDKLNPNLAIMLGLTEEEYDRLNEAIRKTKRRYDLLAIQSATDHLSDDGKTLEVSVPSLAAGGDALYSGLLNEFGRVLGPERYQLFNALAGNAFDTSFNRFGLNPVTYTLTTQPTKSGGTSRYSVSRSYTDANGKGGGASSGVYSLPALQKTFPVLAHFLPQDPGGSSAADTGR